MLSTILFCLFVFGMLKLGGEKAGSFERFKSDVVGTVIPERISLVGAFNKEFTAEVTGQEGTQGYKVQGKERIWTVGADCLSKASVQSGIPIEGGLKDKGIEIEDSEGNKKTVHENTFSVHALGVNLNEAYFRQIEKAKQPARKRGKKGKK